MKTVWHIPWTALLIILILSIWALGELPAIPFHPDESTQLFMSSDFRQALTHPRSLAFDPDRKTDWRQSYRLLDAPLTRYLIGAGLAISGQAPLAADWNWSLDWEANQATGALPTDRQLLAGRLAIALTLPFSLVLIYLSGHYLGGFWSGILSVLLLGTNALVLLHGRRAMAEGPLLLGICAFLASLSIADRKPWLAGLALGLAVIAKQSALVLLPTGLLAVAWSSDCVWLTGKRGASGMLQYLLAFGLLTSLLNPVFWRQPLEAVRAAVQVRQSLLDRQVADVRRALPQHYLETPGERAVTLLAHLYLAPPMFAEAGNYRADTAPAEGRYLANPLHHLARDPAGAGLFLGFTLLGLFSALDRVRRAAPAIRRGPVLYFLATLSVIGALILAVPLAWQRYAIPLVPLVCLWSSLGIVWLGDLFSKFGFLFNALLHKTPARSR